MGTSRGAATKPKQAPRPRHARAAERRQAILDAGLAVFAEQGFAAARMDEVARRAGVAKGTIYLHFADKEALFVGIVRAVLVTPIAEATSGPPLPGESVRAYLSRRLVPLVADLAGSRRGDVIRLLMAEGGRFPELAEAYHREVVSVGMGLIRSLAARAHADGAAGGKTLERFPQLLFAPALIGLVWGSLFERFEHLDARALIEAQLDLLFGQEVSRG